MNFLPLSGDFIVMIILLIIVVLVVTVFRALFILLPAIIVGGAIWFLTHNIMLTALGFLIIAILSFVRRRQAPFGIHFTQSPSEQRVGFLSAGPEGFIGS